jgi:flagellar protein FlaG
MEALRIDSRPAPAGTERNTVRREATPAELTEPASRATRGPEHAPAVASESSETRSTRESRRTQAERTAQRRETAHELQEQLRTSERHDLEISYSEEGERFVVRFLDAENGEIVRQIPAESIIAANQRLDELRGLLFDEKS